MDFRNFRIATLALILFASLASCEKEDNKKDENKKDSCSGTDVSANSWSVIHSDGNTTNVTVTLAEIRNDKPSDDRIRYSFQKEGPYGGDVIDFTFKGDVPPVSGVYSIIGVGDIGANQVNSMGLGSGTGTTGGGLFPMEDGATGNITVTNNSGVITIIGKGLKYRTAMSLKPNLCVSLNLKK